MQASTDERAPRRRSPGLGTMVHRARTFLGRIRRPSRAEMAAWFGEQLETEAKARSAFFLVPIGLMIGIAVVDGAGFRMGLAPATILCVPALVLAWHMSGRGSAGGAALLLAFTLSGMVLASAELRWTTTTIFSGEATVRIEGRVAWRDRDDRNRLRYLVRIERTERPVLSRPPEIASILVSSRHDPIPVGGRFKGLVRLRAPSGPAYPGAYDFAFAPWFEGRGANGFALGAPDAPAPSIEAPTLGERLVRLRLAISDRIRDVIGGGAGAVAAALMTGERSGIPNDIDDWLRATGLSHVLSISGLHMALVAGFAMTLVRGFLAAIPGAVLVLPAKKIAAVAALLVATAYLVISGSNVATDRSYVMLSIMLLAILVDRPALTLRNVALAAIVVLVSTPHAVVTASFQMSFAATMALVGLYGGFSRWRAKRPDAPRDHGPALAVVLFLAGLVASSIIAGTATAPYAAYHFQRVAPYGVIANLVALPVFSFWIMPLALIAALLMPFGLDAPFLVLLGWGLDLVFAFAELLATNLPDAPSGRLTAIGLVVVTIALLVACLFSSRLRWLGVPVALLGLVLLPDRNVRPDLLIFEDGREVATIDERGDLHSLRPKPNDFVFEQWTKAFATPPASPREKPLSAKAVIGGSVASKARQGDDAGGDLRLDKSRSTFPEPTGSEEKEATRPTTLAAALTAAQKPRTDVPFSSAFACEPSPLPVEVERLHTTEPRLSTRTSSRPTTLSKFGVQSRETPSHLLRTPNSAVADSDTMPSRGASSIGMETIMSATAPKRLSPESAVNPTNSALDESGRAVIEDSASRSDGETRFSADAASNSPPTPPIPTARRPPPPRTVCRATTRNGLRIAWTDDHRLTDLVCEGADIAIVARATAARTCASGARLLTLRTLRRTGSIAVFPDGADRPPILSVSITDPDAPWNRHRRERWPEYWRKPNPPHGVDSVSPQGSASSDVPTVGYVRPPPDSGTR